MLAWVRVPRVKVGAGRRPLLVRRRIIEFGLGAAARPMLDGMLSVKVENAANLSLSMQCFPGQTRTVVKAEADSLGPNWKIGALECQKSLVALTTEREQGRRCLDHLHLL